MSAIADEDAIVMPNACGAIANRSLPVYKDIQNNEIIPDHRIDEIIVIIDQTEKKFEECRGIYRQVLRKTHNKEAARDASNT